MNKGGGRLPGVDGGVRQGVLKYGGSWRLYGEEWGLELVDA